MNISVSKLINDSLVNLNPRSREVLVGRYGLKDGNPKTLIEIGNKYGVTRERIRQIEAHGLKDVRGALDGLGVENFVKLVKDHLSGLGGLRRENLFLSDLSYLIADANTPHLANKVRFLLEVMKEPNFYPEDNEWHSYWHLSDEDQKRASSLVAKLVKTMEMQKTKVLNTQDIQPFILEVAKPHNLKDLVALNYISTSKHFHINEYGNFGLAHWSEINPRTMKDWAYVVLKKNRQPLHFQEITQMINKVRKDKRKTAHPQTVHNELIKDERFVLVGRGMYGLEEFGYMPGTAKEVIARLFKKHGTLSPNQLLDLIAKERVFKKNTILINLQNRKNFKRLADGNYTLV